MILPLKQGLKPSRYSIPMSSSSSINDTSIKTRIKTRKIHPDKAVV